MFKAINIIGIAIFFILGLFSLGFSEESMTITTYYPSPYGSYNELRSNQMSIGSGYASSTLSNGNLLVEGNVGIGTTDPGADKLDVRGRAYASDGWQTTDADYSEWFEKEEDTRPKDIIGINLSTGKVRKYRPGDQFIGIHASSPAFVGNRLQEADEDMAKTHTIVGLLGQLDFDNSQVAIDGRQVKTVDGKAVGILLSNGKVLIGR